MTSPGEAERFVDEIATVLGGVGLLVANVGGLTGGDLLTSTLEDWQRTFDLNLFHAVRTIRAAVPHMQARGGGSIVCISSISGTKPGPKAQYGAAKAGEIFLAGALAWELAPHRIRVNAVSPGSIMFSGGVWDRIQANEPQRFGDFESRELPWGRLGTPEESPTSWRLYCLSARRGSTARISPWTAHKDAQLHSDDGWPRIVAFRAGDS